MTTVADAGILAGCCGVLWLLLALMVRRAGWFGRAVAFTVAAAATTGAAVALGTWRDAGYPGDILARIESAARTDPVLAAIVQDWIRPPKLPPEQVKEERKIRGAPQETRGGAG